MLRCGWQFTERDSTPVTLTTRSPLLLMSVGFTYSELSFQPPDNMGSRERAAGFSPSVEGWLGLVRGRELRFPILLPATRPLGMKTTFLGEGRQRDFASGRAT